MLTQVRLNLLGKLAIIWLIVSTSDDDDKHKHERSVERFIGDYEILVENLPHCHFVYRKSHMKHDLMSRS
jgi:hypothetical protein